MNIIDTATVTALIAVVAFAVLAVLVAAGIGIGQLYAANHAGAPPVPPVPRPACCAAATPTDPRTHPAGCHARRALSSSTARITGRDNTPCTSTDATTVNATVDHSQSSASTDDSPAANAR